MIESDKNRTTTTTFNHYESLYSTFNQYAVEYQKNPKAEQPNINREIDKKDINKFNKIEKEQKEPQKLEQSKVDKLLESWNKLIAKLENIKAPQKTQESAKSIRKDLIDKLKSLQKTKPKFNEKIRNQVLEKLQQGREQSREQNIGKGR